MELELLFEEKWLKEIADASTDARVAIGILRNVAQQPEKMPFMEGIRGTTRIAKRLQGLV